MTSRYPIMSVARASSSMRTPGRFCFTSGLSIARLRMSPAAPSVAQTRTVCTPSAAYRAIVPAPLDDSSSGWACTARTHRRSAGPVGGGDMAVRLVLGSGHDAQVPVPPLRLDPTVQLADDFEA